MSTLLTKEKIITCSRYFSRVFLTHTASKSSLNFQSRSKQLHRSLFFRRNHRLARFTPKQHTVRQHVQTHYAISYYISSSSAMDTKWGQRLLGRPRNDNFLVGQYKYHFAIRSLLLYQQRSGPVTRMIMGSVNVMGDSRKFGRHCWVFFCFVTSCATPILEVPTRNRRTCADSKSMFCGPWSF